MSGYDDMLKRLKAYRKASGLKQRQICESMGVTQEQYSYLENGAVKLTDENMKRLYGIGLNPDYLITGKEYDYDAGDLDAVLDGLDEAHRRFAVKMLAEVIVEKWERGTLHDRSDKILGNVKFLAAALRSWDEISMIGFVREDNGCSQFDMMGKLGVGIKKYRALEKEKQYPDAELLLNLYSMSGYPPAMFMNISDRKLLSVRAVWHTLKAEERRELIRFIRQLVKLV